VPEADAVAELADELGAPVPPEVARLYPENLEHLAGLIAQARHRQAAEIATAGERALSFVPRLLRAPLQKMLR
jgi:predicted ATPase